MSKGKHGGIELLPGYVLNRTLLTEDEKIDITSSLQSLNALDADSVETTLVKLSAFFGEKNGGYYEIDFNDWGSLIREQFEISKQAISLRKLLSFEYVSSFNEKSQRTVEPYKLCFKERTWYLKAFCLKKNAIRLFRFSRMRTVKMLDEQFTLRDISLLECEVQSHFTPTTEIMMRIEADSEYRILDEFPKKDVTKNKDGSFIVKMNFIEDDWVYGYILSYGASATVIQPDRIRKNIQQLLEKSLRNYS